MKTKILLFFLLITSVCYSQIQPLDHTAPDADNLKEAAIKINANFNYIDAVASTSGINTYVANLNPAISSYVNGQRFFITFSDANTGVATLSLNGLAATSIVKSGSAPLIAGDIKAGQTLQLYYGGGAFQILGDGGGDQITVSNGLTKTGNDISLGGSITSGDININTTGLGTDLNFQRSGVNLFGTTGAPTSAYFGEKVAGIFIRADQGGSMSIQDNRTTKIGLVYGADYSPTYLDRSLIDKGFANSSYWKINGTTNLVDGTTILAPVIGNVNIKSNGDGLDFGIINLISSPDGVAESARMILDGGPIRLSGTAMQYTAAFSMTNPRDIIDRGFADANYKKSLMVAATLDFPSTVATAVSRLTISVPGASFTDPVTVGVPVNSVTPTGTYSAWVSAADVVTVQFSPKATEDPSPDTFKVIVHKL